MLARNLHPDLAMALDAKTDGAFSGLTSWAEEDPERSFHLEAHPLYKTGVFLHSFLGDVTVFFQVVTLPPEDVTRILNFITKAEKPKVKAKPKTKAKKAPAQRATR